MPSKFYSFGFKHGRPRPHADVLPLIIDIRDEPGFRNPWKVEGFHSRNGLDPDVQAYIVSGPGFSGALDALRDRVKGHPGPVYIGCTGGQHRSVYLVELLSAFFECEREHLHLTGHPTKGGTL